MEDFPIFKEYLKSNITPDVRWIKRHNERTAKFYRFNRLLMLLAFLLINATIVSASIYTYLMLALAAITYAIIKWRIYRGDIDKKYLKSIFEEGWLIPAILINKQPYTILAIARLNINYNSPKRFGCYTMEVKKLPGTSFRLYEKIPCTALFGYDKGEYFYSFVPYPLCWGTKRKEEIEWASRLLDAKMNSENVNEWEVLKNIAAESEILGNNSLLILDENYRPIGNKNYLES